MNFLFSMDTKTVPLRVLRSSSSAAPNKRDSVPSPIVPEIGLAALPPSTSQSIESTPDSQHSDSHEVAAASSASTETVFSLDRDHIESLFKAVLPSLHEPLTEQLSRVSLEMYASKILQAILSLIVVAKFLTEILTTKR